MKFDNEQDEKDLAELEAKFTRDPDSLQGNDLIVLTLARITDALEKAFGRIKGLEARIDKLEGK